MCQLTVVPIWLSPSVITDLAGNRQYMQCRGPTSVYVYGSDADESCALLARAMCTVAPYGAVILVHPLRKMRLPTYLSSHCQTTARPSPPAYYSQCGEREARIANCEIRPGVEARGDRDRVDGRVPICGERAHVKPAPRPFPPAQY